MSEALGYFWFNTQAASFFASASFTCALAGLPGQELCEIGAELRGVDLVLVRQEIRFSQHAKQVLAQLQLR